MSNYRVRQVMQLTRPHRAGGHWKPAHKDVLIGLATYLTDDSLSVKVTNERLAEASGRDRWALNLAKREMAKDSVIAYEPGRHRGEITTYHVLVDLPALSEGVDPESSPSEGVDPESSPSGSRKGWTSGHGRGGPRAEKGVDLLCADQAERDNSFNLLAKPSPRARELAEFVIAEVCRHSGTTITTEEAEHGITNKLNGSAVRQPERWLAKVIASDPAWWLPTPQPPRFRNGRFEP